jgi:hypothetical protein
MCGTAKGRNFEAYQSVQGPKNAFNVGGLVASFVVRGLDEMIWQMKLGSRAKRLDE